MKKLIMIGMTLLLMGSCVKYPQIILKISEEEAAVIPYEMGQTVRFLDQNGDTLAFQVIRDETYPFENADQLSVVISGGTIFTPNGFWCYARTVVLANEQDGKKLAFTILPKKEFQFNTANFASRFSLGLNLSLDGTCTINGIDYEQVQHEVEHDNVTGELFYDWYYNAEFGLLYFEKGDFSLTRIP